MMENRWGAPADAIEVIVEIIEELNLKWQGETEQLYERNLVMAKLKEAQFWLNEIEEE